MSVGVTPPADEALLSPPTPKTSRARFSGRCCRSLRRRAPPRSPDASGQNRRSSRGPMAPTYPRHQQNSRLRGPPYRTHREVAADADRFLWRADSPLDRIDPRRGHHDVVDLGGHIAPPIPMRIRQRVNVTLKRCRLRDALVQDHRKLAHGTHTGGKVELGSRLDVVLRNSVVPQS
jgi:hypothetical protein